MSCFCIYVCVYVCVEQIYKENHCFHCCALLSLQILRALTHNFSEPKQHVLWEVASFSLLDPASEMNSQPFLCEQMSAASALKVRWKWQSVPPSVCETDLTAAVKHSCCCCCCCCVGGFTAPECGFFFFLVDLVVVQIILKRLKRCGLFYFSLPTSQVACHTSQPLIFFSAPGFSLCYLLCVWTSHVNLQDTKNTIPYTAKQRACLLRRARQITSATKTFPS